ncbi:MAG TPA: GTPase [Mycobacteriales bacterium]|nr:GTPase [Mycobacteriales bacterium]
MSRGGSALAERLAALDEVVALARGRLDPPVVDQAARVAGKAGARLRLGAEHTVVALAGATGSGKSSLLNALAGADVSAVGVRRPTTSAAAAVVWGADGSGGAGTLLDWLEVPRRHAAGDPGAAGPAAADGLVLLDLPDFDSVRLSHRLEVDRLVELVDLLVWVLDPQKYADAALHEHYLRPLAGHSGVMLVVLNQVDRLEPAARDACLADLRRLLDREGLGGVPVLATSATTGEGLDALRRALAERAAARRAAVHRLEADVQRTAVALRPSCASAPPRRGAQGAGPGSGAVRPAGDWSEVAPAVNSRTPHAGRAGMRREDRTALVEALTDAAGAETIATAVARSHRARAATATGWPFSRWVRKLRPDPVRRLRLPPAPSELVRTSLPGPSAVQRARVDTALRTLTDHATDGLPDPWPAVVRRAATAATADLPDQLDRTAAGTDLGLGRQPRWWMLAGFLQAVLAVAAVAGLVWLLGLLALDWLRLPEPPLPHLGRVPLPTLLLAGGALAGLLLALLARRLAAAGARRRARTARRRVRDRVEQLADERVLAPVQAELSVHKRLCEAVDRLGR